MNENTAVVSKKTTKPSPQVISSMNKLIDRFQEMINTMVHYSFNHIVIHYILESLFDYINATVFNTIMDSQNSFSATFGFNLKLAISHLTNSVRNISPFGDLLEFFSKDRLVELTEISNVLVILPNSSKDLLRNENDLRTCFPSLNINQIRFITNQFSTSKFVFF